MAPKPKNGFDKRPQDINRNGRPPLYFNKLIREVGEEVDADEKVPLKELVVRRLWAEALKGNLNAISEVIDRLDGKALQQTDLTSGGERLDALLHIYRPEKLKK